MTLDTARDFFLWTTLLNYGVLLVWFAAFALAKDWLRRVHGQWFRLSGEQFDLVHYAAMGVYKIGILLFGLVPLLALYAIG